MLKFNGLNYSYAKNKPILKNICGSIPSGITMLVGENGSGKTTLLKCICGILGSSDVITYDDIPISEQIKKGYISYLPQDFSVYPNLTVYEILRFVAQLKGVNKEKIDDNVLNILQCCGIVSFQKYPLKKCSEGTKRRVGIATALIGDPQIILLDEPTAGVDPKERFRFYKFIKDLVSDKTVVISTHILDDLAYLADRVVMLSSGTIVFNDSYSVFEHILDDKVYSCNCSTKEFDDFKAQYDILSCNYESGNVYFHIFSESKIPGTVPAKASTEDLWIYFQELYQETHR